VLCYVSWWFIGCTEQLLEMRFDRKAGEHLVAVGGGFDQGGIGIEFLTPDEVIITALLDNGLKELAEDGDAVTVTNARHAGVIRYALVEVIAQEPADTQTVATDAFCRSDRIPSKNMTNWSLKNTTGSMDGRPKAA
jgi:hypothetical protein